MMNANYLNATSDNNKTQIFQAKATSVNKGTTNITQSIFWTRHESESKQHMPRHFNIQQLWKYKPILKGFFLDIILILLLSHVLVEPSLR